MGKGPKVRNYKLQLELQITIFFVVETFVFTIFYTGSFQVPPEKNHPHLKYQFPPKISI